MPRLTERWAYEQPGSLSDSTIKDRALFLDAVSEHRSQVLTHLYRTTFVSFVLFVFQRFGKFLADVPPPADSSKPEVFRYLCRIPQKEVESGIRDWGRLQRARGTKELREKLKEWARAHNLAADWCLDQAVRALRLWMYDERLRWSDEAVPFHVSDLVPAWREAAIDLRLDLVYSRSFLFTDTHPESTGNPEPFAFEYEGARFEAEGWNYLQEGKEEWKRATEERFDAFRQQRLALKQPLPKGMLTALRKALAGYVRKQDAAKRAVVKKHGLVKRPRSYADHKPDDHLKWLTMYQIPPCQKYREIAEQAGIGYATVRKSVEAAARRIGVPLRNPREHTGRPLGSKGTSARRVVHRERVTRRGKK